MTATIDQVALIPAYVAAGTALLAFVTDLIVPGRRVPILAVTCLGAAGTAVAAWIIGAGDTRRAFCVPDGCSLVADRTGALIAVTIALLTLAVATLSPALLRDGLPPGEYCFLLAASMTGGVVLGYARDLITLVVALETLTLPLYALVALRRRRVSSAEGAVVFFVVSVVSSAITLMGAALLYAVTGALHFGRLNAVLAAHPALRDLPLTRAAAVLVIAGLAFKIAAVPFHAWAPAAYDGAPTPIAAYLSTASKVGGVIAILFVSILAVRPVLPVTGVILAALAVVTMTIGNITALRQDRMVRLLAWSSIAQAGYILAPLGAFAVAGGRTREALVAAVGATLAYTVFYVVLEIAAFGAVIAARGAGDGGMISDYRGLARRRPWLGAVFVLALIGLAGLPPGLAGLFAKVVVVRSLLTGDSAWLAIIVAINAVIGLAYYARVIAEMFATPSGPPPRPAVSRAASAVRAIPWTVVATLAIVTVAGLVIGFAPQLVLHVVDTAALR